MGGAHIPTGPPRRRRINIIKDEEEEDDENDDDEDDDGDRFKVSYEQLKKPWMKQTSHCV